VTATPVRDGAGSTGGSGAAGRATAGAMDGLRALRRDTWTLALFGLFLALLAVAKILSPGYGASELTSLAIGTLPVAFAAVAMTIVVISGGIDLSVGAMMALTSVAAAVQMKGASPEFAVVVVLGVLVLGLILGTVNGLLIVTSRVPDIVVTLAMSYVWAGAALLVLGSPGGSAADWLKSLILGSVGTEFLPRPWSCWRSPSASSGCRSGAPAWASRSMPSAAARWPRSVAASMSGGQRSWRMR